jgi:hypothetical protein
MSTHPYQASIKHFQGEYFLGEILIHSTAPGKPDQVLNAMKKAHPKDTFEMIEF